MFQKSNRVLGPWGDTLSKILIIGQSLCTQCVDAGEPFYGHSGDILDRIFNLLSVDKRSLLITNVVLHNPERNRPSSIEEIKNCRTFLKKTIALQKPYVIITLGRDAHTSITDRPFSINTTLESKLWLRTITGLPDIERLRVAHISEAHPAFYYRAPNRHLLRMYIRRFVNKIKYSIKLIDEGRIR